MESFSADTFFTPDDLTPSGRLSKAAVNRAIDALMQQQAGLIGYGQLRQIGLSTKGVTTRARSGELVLRTEPKRRRRPTDLSAKAGPRPVGRAVNGRSSTGPRERAQPVARRSMLPKNGVFARDSRPLDITALRWRAMLAGPDTVRLGDVSSCALLDLCRPTGRTMHVVYTGKTWDPPRGVIAHHVRDLPDIDCSVYGGMPCTSAGRSVFDAARRADDDFLDDVLDRAVELRLYDEADLRRLIAALPNTPNAGQLDAAIARLDQTSGEFRSKFERKVMRLVQTSALLPRAVVNVMVDGFRPDFRFVGTRAIVECDGRDYHRSLAQIRADEEREEILFQRGFEMLRLRWKDIQYEREATLARIERFVLANLAPPVPRG